MLSSLADETPEGRSIVDLCKETLGIRGRDMRAPEGSSFLPFSAETRMSGINWDGREIRKGASDAMMEYVEGNGGMMPEEHQSGSGQHSQGRRYPAGRGRWRRGLGAIRLKDVLKEGIKERLIKSAKGWHTIRDDHGRQSDYGRGHRRRGGNR